MTEQFMLQETSGGHRVQSPAQSWVRQQVAQGSVEPGFDCRQAWKLHRLSSVSNPNPNLTPNPSWNFPHSILYLLPRILLRV